MGLHGTIAFTRYKIIVNSGDEYWHEIKPNITMLAINIGVAFCVAVGKENVRKQFELFLRAW